jgi:hypothetical protein
MTRRLLSKFSPSDCYLVYARKSIGRVRQPAVRKVAARHPIPATMRFDRHRVEADLVEIGCDRLRAFEVSSAVSEVVLAAEERQQAYTIIYKPEGTVVTIDVLHYDAKLPGDKVDSRIHGYYMARSLVQNLYIVAGFPRRGFTVRLVADVGSSGGGEIVNVQN